MKLTKNEKLAQEYGKIYAKNMFESMLDVTLQTDTFNWDKFPQIFEKLCKAGLFIHYITEPANLDALKVIAGTSYIDEGTRLKEEYAKDNKLPLTPVKKLTIK